MSDQRTAASLPSGVLSVLRSFEAESGAEVRVFAAGDGGRMPLYPAATSGARGRANSPVRRRIDAGAAGEFELELSGGDVDERAAAMLAGVLGRMLGYEREAELAARELAERYEEINLLYSITETLGSIPSLEAAAARILSEVAELLGARRASLWVHEPADDMLHLVAAVGDEGATAPIDVADLDSVTAMVFRERRPVNLEQDGNPGRSKRLEPATKGPEAFLSVPIQFTPPEGPSRTVGVITLIGRRANVRFSAGDVRLLSAIASQVGAAIETHRLMKESVRQERLVRELELAHDLQMKLLPDAAQFGGPGEVAARCVPADSIGGDFYQLFRLSEGRLGVMIGDVSSHGFSAALIMALTMSAVAIYAQEAGPPAEVLRRVHQALIDELSNTEMYMTLFYAVLDTQRRVVTYANAGHPHAFRITAPCRAVRLAPTSPPLGISTLGEYSEARSEWRAGEDLLLLFTDGLSNAFAPGGGRSSEAALVREACGMRERPPAEILEALFRQAGQAGSSDIPADDRTAVLIRA
jgi:phosphoserine phosphatase RsbU/P